ncbi:MAG: hypothetical protein MMC23_008155 [Stictis urceolatum]|nr:hypothetical protein [Stictis urceolata]
MTLKINPDAFPVYRIYFMPETVSITLIYSIVLVPLLIVGVASLLTVFQNYFQDDVCPPSGCSKIGMHKKSNIEDEQNPRYLDEATASNHGNWKVKSIFIYPLKSCRGVEMEKADLVDTGLKYDRQFSFAQLKSPFPMSEQDSKETTANHQWKFVTQREYPLLVQVKTEVWVPDPRSPSYSTDLPFVQTAGAIVITFPWQEDGWKGMLANFFAWINGSRPEKSFKVPFNPTEEQIHRDYMQESFTIWKETVSATNMGLHIPPEFKYFLGCRNPLTLFRVRSNREVFRTAPRKEALGFQPVTGFADAFPLHILGVSSMQELSRTQAPGSPSLSVKRFRPNIIAEGAPPYEEEKWTKIEIGGQVYYVACRCVRCLIPNINPDTGVRHGSEPNKTLRATRNVDAGAPLSGCLGMNMVPAKLTGEIHVGDELKVLEEGEHVYMPM